MHLNINLDARKEYIYMQKYNLNTIKPLGYLYTNVFHILYQCILKARYNLFYMPTNFKKTIKTF